MTRTIPFPQPVKNTGTTGGYLLQYPDGSFVGGGPFTTLASANAAVRAMS